MTPMIFLKGRRGLPTMLPVVAGGGGGVSPVLLEDFSSPLYTDTVAFLADPRGIWNRIEQHNDIDIVLDTTVGYGSSTKSMRYDWQNLGSVCDDYAINPGILTFPTPLTHAWIEYVVRFKSNFRVNSGSGGCAAEYKLASMGEYGGPGRWNIPEMQEGAWVLSSPQGFLPTVVGSFSPAALWDGQPHVFRVEGRTSVSGNNGLLKFWVDGTLIRNESGFNDSAGQSTIDCFGPGLNLNQGPNISGMQMWWHRIAVYDTDPGWT